MIFTHDIYVVGADATPRTVCLRPPDMQPCTYHLPV